MSKKKNIEILPLEKLVKKYEIQNQALIELLKKFQNSISSNNSDNENNNHKFEKKNQ